MTKRTNKHAAAKMISSKTNGEPSVDPELDRFMQGLEQLKLLRRLEPRIMFDGAALVTADAIDNADAAAAGVDAAAAPAPVADLVNVAADLAAAASTAGAPATGTSVVFIDGGVADPGALAAAATAAGSEVVILDPAQDGLTQIAAYVQNRDGISSIHILSHGKSGELNLGTATLTTASIQGQYADELATIGAALTTDGDILIYGCSFGDDQIAVDALAAATGADIAASNDDTGAADLGGDWDLEVAAGTVEAVTISVEDWHGLLAPMTISATGAPVVTGTGAAGTTALWLNAGSVDGVAIDLRATVISENSIGLPYFGTSGNDPFFQLTGAGSAELKWEIFQGGTNQAVFAFGNPTFTVADVDGVGGNPFTRETVTPGLNGLTSFATETVTNVQVFVQNGVVEASGTQNQNGELTSAVSFTWNNVASWNITYTLDPLLVGAQARFTHDGNGDVTFFNPADTFLLQLDLDGNDSTAVGTAYNGAFIPGGAAVAIVDIDDVVTQHVALGANLGSATVTLTNAQAGDTLNVAGLPAGIASTVDTSVPGKITVTLTGVATVADYQTALQAITFGNPNAVPSGIDRQIEVFVTNDTYGTNSATALSTIVVNNPPVAVNDPAVTDEDTAITVSIANGVIGNDSDPDNDTLSVVAINGQAADVGVQITLASGAFVTLNADGSFSYDPNGQYEALGAGQSATDSFDYTISDGRGGTASATATVTIDGVNDAPVAVNDGPVTVQPGTLVTLDVVGNDTDPEGDTLTVTQIIDPANPGTPIAITVGSPATLANGTLVALNANGTLDVTPAAGMAETETFDYVISDGNGGTAQATVTLARDSDGDTIADIDDLDDDNDGILDINDGQVSSVANAVLNPSAQNGLTNWTSGGNNNFFAQGVANRFFLNADQAGVSTLSQNIPSFDNNNGTVTLSFDAWTSDGNGTAGKEIITSIGFDGVTYFEIHNTTGGTATVTALNGATFTGPATLNLPANAIPFTLTIPTAATSGTLELTANVLQIVAGAGDDGGFGNFVLNNTTVTTLDTDGDGVADYLDLDADNDGIADLIESGASAALIAADTNNDGTISLAEAQAVNGGIADADGDGLMDIFDANVADVTAAASVGSVPVNSDNDALADFIDLDSDNDGIADAVEARPTAGYVSSTHANNAANKGVNDDGLYIPEDTDNDGTADYLDTDSDDDGTLDSIESGLTPGLDANGDGIGDGVGASYADPDGIVNNPVADLINIIGSVNEADYREDNTPPVAQNDIVTVVEDTPALGNVLADNGNGADSDLDGDTLTVTGFVVAGDLTVYAPGTTATIPGVGALVIGTNGVFTFTPVLNYNGPVPVVSYTITDGKGGTASADLLLGPVTPVNDAPVATDDGPVVVQAAVPVNIVPLSNDTDVDGDTLTITHIIDPAAPNNPLPIAPGGTVVLVSGTSVTLLANGTLNVTPATNIPETETFDYTISDGNGGTAQATVSLARDSDGDTIADIDDLDDDNDGILDINDGQVSSVANAVLNPSAQNGLTNWVSGGNNNFFAQGVANRFFLNADQVGLSTLSQSIAQFDNNNGTVTLSFDAWTSDGNGVAGKEIITSIGFDGVTYFEIHNTTGGTATVTALNGATFTGPATLNLPANAIPFTLTIPTAATSGTLELTANVLQIVAGAGDDGGFGNFVLNNTTVTTLDTDGDGVADYLDLDADNDGIADLIESGASAALIAADTNNDGTISLAEAQAANGGIADADGDGLMDIFDANIADATAAASVGSVPVNSDNDALADFIDLDSDNDGIADAVEARPTAGYVSSTHVNNAANKGVNDDGLYIPEDTDNDGTADYLDTDSDDDGTLDSIESGLTPGLDANGDGIGDGVGASYADPDGIVNNPSIVLTNQYGDTSEVAYREANVAPVAVNDGPLTVVEDTPLTGDILTNDSDADGDTLSVTGFVVAGDLTVYAPGTTATIPGVGDLLINADGSFTFTPALNYNGPVPAVTYTISDGKGGTASANLLLGPVTPVNDAPVAVNDTAATDEDTAITIAAPLGLITPNDTDVDNDPLVVSAVNGNPAVVGTQITLASGALLTVNADGSFSYDPNGKFESLAAGQPATDSFNYQITDGNGGFDTATMTINITGVNDAPTVSAALSDQSSTDGSATLTIPTIGNFTDKDGDALTFSLAPGAPAWLTIDPATGIISTNGAIPADASQQTNIGGGLLGSYDVTVIGTDPSGANASDTLLLTITNLAPVAVADLSTVSEDGPAATGNVIIDALTGDADSAPDSDILNVSAASQGGNVITIGQAFTTSGGGQLTLNADGSYSFDPSFAYQNLDVNETAQEVIAYTISDGQGGFASTTLTIDIIGANDAPVVIDPNNPINDPLSPLYQPNNPAGPVDPNNIIPAQTGDDSAPLTPLDVSPFFTDVDVETLTFGLDPVGLPTWLTIDPVSGVITGTPPSDASQLGPNNDGVYPITVTATDPDGAVVTTVVSFTITNPAPIAQNDDLTGDEDTGITGSLFTDNGAGADIDPDGDVFVVSEVNGVPANVGAPVAGSNGGTFTVNPDGTYSFDPGLDFQNLDVGETLTTMITYQIDDNQGGTDVAVVTVTVTGLNDAPVVIDPNNPINDPLSPLYQPNNPAGPVDPNNIIPAQTGDDSAPLTPLDVSPFFTDVDVETLTFGLDPVGLPTWLTIDPVSGVITGTPPSDASQFGPNNDGVYPITVTATDPDGAVVTTVVSFTIANPAPIAQNDALTGDEDTVVTGSLFVDNGNGADIDPDGDVFVVSEVNGVPANVGAPVAGSNGGTFTVNPDGTYSFDPGLDFQNLDVGETLTTTITYQIDDNQGGTDIATVTVTVTGVNDAPVVIDPNNPINDPLSPLYQPNNPAGPVDPNNIIPAQTGDDSAPLTPLDISPFFTDVDVETLTFGLDPVGLPTWLAIDPLTGVITGTPPSDASQFGPNSDGVYPITVTATDPDGAVVTTVVSFTIANPAPIAQNDALTGDEDTIVTGSLFADNGAGADIDPDGDVIVVSQVNGVPANVGAPVAGSNGGTFTVNPDGTYSFDPGLDFQNLDVGETLTTTITYQIDDNQGGTDIATVTVTVTGLNDAPVVIDPNNPINDPLSPLYQPNNPAGPVDPNNIIPAQTGDDSAPLTPLDISPFFTDVDVETLTFGLDPVGLPTWLTIDPLTGVITGTPPSDASQFGPNNDGVYPITVTATDPDGAVVTTVVSFTIANPAPIAQNDALTGDEDTVVTGSLFVDNGNGADIDPDGDVFVVSEVNGVPANVGAPVAGSNGGTFTVNPDGTYSFDPGLDFQNLDVGETLTTTITYQIDDNQGGTDIATVTVTVTGLNDAPVVIDPNNPINDPLSPLYQPNNPAGPVDPNNIIPAQTGDDSAPLTPLDISPFFTDVDVETLTFGLDPVGLPTWLTIDPATGVITGTPPSDASQLGPNSDGVYPITVTATDPDGAIVTTVVSFTILNPAPIAVDDALTGDEDTIVTGSLFADNGAGADTDPDGDVIVVSQVNGVPANVGAPIAGSNGGTFTVNPDGTYSFDPGLDFQNLDVGETLTTTITYQIDDNQGGTDIATVTVTVTGLNDAPVVIDPNNPINDPLSPLYQPNNPAGPVDPNNIIPAQTGDDSAPLTPLDISPFFTDVDVETLTFGLDPVGLPAWLTIDPVSGIITGTSPSDASQLGPNNNGVYPIIVTATDPDGTVVTTVVSFTILNPAPIAVDDVLSVNEDTPLISSVAGNDSDPDGDAVTFAVLSGPSHGTLVFNPDGSFSFTPDANYNGPDSFTYQITDADGATATATASITVAAVNDAPTVDLPGTATTSERTDLPLPGITVGEIDQLTGPITVELSAGHGALSVLPGSGVVITISPDGHGLTLEGAPDDINAVLASLTYAPDFGYVGAESLVISINDNGNTGIGGPLQSAGAIDIEVKELAKLNVSQGTVNSEGSGSGDSGAGDNGAGRSDLGEIQQRILDQHGEIEVTYPNNTFIHFVVADEIFKLETQFGAGENDQIVGSSIQKSADQSGDNAGLFESLKAKSLRDGLTLVENAEDEVAGLDLGSEPALAAANDGVTVASAPEQTVPAQIANNVVEFGAKSKQAQSFGAALNNANNAFDRKAMQWAFDLASVQD